MSSLCLVDSEPEQSQITRAQWERVILTKTFCDVIDLINVRVTRKYRVSRQHLCIEAANGPDVDLPAVGRVAHQELRRPVPAGGHVVRVYLALSGHYPGKPKVTEFDDPELGDQNILRLDISVNDLQSEMF